MRVVTPGSTCIFRILVKGRGTTLDLKVTFYAIEMKLDIDPEFKILLNQPELRYILA